jgi:predicted nucleotidyltransferase component of viral defense system
MMNIESIKDKIRSLAKEHHLSTQEILQMYFFERFLERLSQSKHRINFVIKGGLLISSLIGVKNRTTMEMDTTVKGIPLEEKLIKKIVEEIISIENDDGIKFGITGMEHIREEDDYDHFRISMIANIGKTKNPMKMDITTGDPITPKEIEYKYPCIFTKDDIKVLAYPLETILAEKYESIIKRNITTTRMRDFYDVYALFKLKEKEVDFDTLRTAVIRTATKRDSLDMMRNHEDILNDMKDDSYLRNLWEVYIKENKYVGDLAFDKALDVLAIFSEKINL